VVTADSQTAGRGRRGRTWFAEPGTSLLYSLVIRPTGDRPLLPLSIPIAVCEAAESLADVRCQIKWPNDVWIDGRKLAGVLIEGRPDRDPDASWSVIGIGMNLDLSSARIPPELTGRVAWLGDGATAERVREQLNDSIASWLDAGERKILEEFARRDLLEGRDLSWDGGSGRAAGVDKRGHLLVETEGGGMIALGAGEVSISAASSDT